MSVNCIYVVAFFVAALFTQGISQDCEENFKTSSFKLANKVSWTAPTYTDPVDCSKKCETDNDCTASLWVFGACRFFKDPVISVTSGKSQPSECQNDCNVMTSCKSADVFGDVCIMYGVTYKDLAATGNNDAYYIEKCKPSGTGASSTDKALYTGAIRH